MLRFKMYFCFSLRRRGVYNLCRPVKKEARLWALTNCSTAIIVGRGPCAAATAQLARTDTTDLSFSLNLFYILLL